MDWKLLGALFGSLVAVIGFLTFGYKLFGFLNKFTEFITTVAPKLSTSMLNIELNLDRAVSSHLTHLQTSAERLLELQTAASQAQITLAQEMTSIRKELYSHELEDAKVQNQILDLLRYLHSGKETTAKG